MDYVQCGHFDFNAASAKLQKKLGFVHLTTVELDFEGTALLSETEHVHVEKIFEQQERI